MHGPQARGDAGGGGRAKGPALVTGATGFAGSHLLDHLLDTEPHVVAWSHAGGRPVESRRAAGRVTWCAVDVTDRGAVLQALRETRPSVVYHCAGLAGVQAAWTDSARALQVNAMGTHVVLGSLQRAGLRIPVLVTGSALVYRPSPEPLTEESPLGPSTPYGVSKLAQEMVAAAAEGLDVLIIRAFNHAGPRQDDSYVTSGFARQIAEAEAGIREAVLRVGNLEARRDITDVRDTVRAYRLLVERGRPAVPYNVCRGEAFRVADLLDVLLRHSRVPITVETDPARLRPADTPLVLGSPARLRADTGWEPRIAVEQTLVDTLAYWRSRVRSQARA